MSGVSNHFDTMSGLAGIITAIAMNGMSSAPVIQAVLDYKFPDMTTPVILIAPWGSEQVNDYLNDQDEVLYPTAIAIVSGYDPTEVVAGSKLKSLEQLMGWRQQIRRRVHNVPVPVSGAAGYRLSVNPGPVVEPVAWLKDSKLISTLVVSAAFGEPRF